MEAGQSRYLLRRRRVHKDPTSEARRASEGNRPGGPCVRTHAGTERSYSSTASEPHGVTGQGSVLLALVMQTICKTNHANFGGTARHRTARSPNRAVRNGTRRNRRHEHEATGLITQRSLVQIQPARRAEPEGEGPRWRLLIRRAASFRARWVPGWPRSQRWPQEPGQPREIVISVT